MRCRCGLVADHALEPFDGGKLLSSLGGRKAERDSGPDRRDRVAGAGRLRQDLFELRLGPGHVVGQAQFELRVAEAQLAVVDLTDVPFRGTRQRRRASVPVFSAP